MIYINLANSLIAKSGVKATGVKISPKQLAIKVALIVLPIICVMAWEKKTINDKKAQLVITQNKNNELAAELSGFGSIDDMVRSVDNQKKDLDEKFNVIRQIFGLRSQKIQSLFAIQDKLPPKVWITQLICHDKTIAVTGFAQSIEEAGDFARSLSDMQDLFSSVNTTNSSLEKVNNSDYFKFDIFIKLKE